MSLILWPILFGSIYSVSVGIDSRSGIGHGYYKTNIAKRYVVVGSGRYWYIDEPTGNSGSSNAAAAPSTVQSCFSADSNVVTQFGPISMSDLYQFGKKDIQTLTANGQFSPIAFWLHAEPQKSTEFIRIATIGAQTITLTRGHLLFKTDCDRIKRQSVRAEKISIGDCLLVDNDGQLQAQPILKVDKITSVGIYSPVTVSGDLLVDNILVSCYSEVEAVQLQLVMFSYLKIVKFIAQRLLSHNLYNIVFGHSNNIMHTFVAQVFRLSGTFIATT